MKFTINFSLVFFAVALFGACGDVNNEISTEHSLNSGNDRLGHQFVVREAVERLLAAPDGSVAQYMLAKHKETFLKYLLFGVKIADDSQRNCKWRSFYDGNCESIHHYWKLKKLEYGVDYWEDIDVGHPGEYSAPQYAGALFKLALRFWPRTKAGSDRPRLSDLPLKDAGYNQVSGLDRKNDLGRSYLGGEPFCEKVAEEEGQKFSHYCPRWPWWAAAQLGGAQNASPKANIGVALEYLGWALHMVQDLHVPYHVWHLADKKHRKWEDSIDELIRQKKLVGLGNPVAKNYSGLDATGYRLNDHHSNKYLDSEIEKDVESFVFQIGQETYDYCKSYNCQEMTSKKALIDRAIRKTVYLLEKFFRFAVVAGCSYQDDHSEVTPTKISLNSTTNGKIDFFEDYDVFSVQTPTKGKLRVIYSSDTEIMGELRGKNLKLYGQTGNGEINAPVTQGTYTIKIYHTKRIALGSYTLKVNFYPNVDDHGNSCADATPIQLYSGSGLINGVINAPGDIDYFKIVLPIKMWVYITTSSDIDTFGFLHMGDCSQPIYNDNSGDDKNFSITQELEAGTYYIGVKHASSTGTGSYRLWINPIT